MTKFEEFGLSKELLDSIKDMGLEEHTEIQQQTIPPIIEQKDVIGESATG